MTRAAAIVALLSAGATLCGCRGDVTAAGEPGGLEWSFALGGYPTQGGPAFYGEIPLPDVSSRDDSLVLGFGTLGAQADAPYYYYYDEMEEYCESVRACYRRYYALSAAQGPRRTRVFWEAGVSAGPTFVPRDPWGDSWDRSEGAHALLGGGVRRWSGYGSEARSPYYVEFAFEVLTDVEASPLVAFALGYSFGRRRPGRAEVPRLGRTRAEIYKARAETRARRKAEYRKGAFGMRTGVLLAASGETADYGQSMLLGLSYRFAEPHDTSISCEFAVDFGLTEDVGSYESTPVLAGINLLFRLGSATEDPRPRLVAGVGAVTEYVSELATKNEYVNTASAFTLGAGLTFAGDQLDMGLAYSFFEGSDNLAERASFIVTCRF